MADLRSLNSALKSKSFEPVYLFHGDDDFRKEGALKAVMEAAVEPAMRDFNCEVRRGAEIDAETLGSLLDTPPMLAERRLVAVRDVGALRKDARAALDRYLARPATDTVLVLLAPAGAKVDKTLLERATAIDFKSLDGQKLTDWLASWAKREVDAELAPGVAELLVSAVGNDLQQLTGELDKLASYARGQGAVARRDATTALGLVDHVLSQPKATAVSVVLALSAQFLALAWGQAMRARGTNPGQLAQAYYGFLREGSAVVGRSWGEAVSAWTSHVDRWTAPALDRALDLLLDADAALKETRVSTDEQLLASLVLSLCA